MLTPMMLPASAALRHAPAALRLLRQLQTSAAVAQPYLNSDTDVKPHFRRAPVDHPIYKQTDEEGRPGACG